MCKGAQKEPKHTDPATNSYPYDHGNLVWVSHPRARQLGAHCVLGLGTGLVVLADLDADGCEAAFAVDVVGVDLGDFFAVVAGRPKLA